MPDGDRHSGPAFYAAVEAEIARLAGQKKKAHEAARAKTDALKLRLSAATTSSDRQEILLEAYQEILRAEEEGRLRDEDLKARLGKCEDKTGMMDTVVEVYKGLADSVLGVQEGQLSKSAEGKVQKITKASAAKWGGGIGGGLLILAEAAKWLFG